jgi:hypothetical protein
MSDYVSTIYFTCSCKHRPNSKQVYIILRPTSSLPYIRNVFVLCNFTDIVIEWNYRIQKQNQTFETTQS